jgi:hypothetical protein
MELAQILEVVMLNWALAANCQKVKAGVLSHNDHIYHVCTLSASPKYQLNPINMESFYKFEPVLKHSTDN